MQRTSWTIQQNQRGSQNIARIQTVLQKAECWLSKRTERRIDRGRRNLRKTRVGKVVSDKMDKTIVVAIETT
jgi:hypothetical protein